MRLLTLRALIASELQRKRRGRSDGEIKSVRWVNPLLPGSGPWGLRVVVDDGAGAELTIRIDFVEED